MYKVQNAIVNLSKYTIYKYSNVNIYNFDYSCFNCIYFLRGVNILVMKVCS